MQAIHSGILFLVLALLDPTSSAETRITILDEGGSETASSYCKEVPGQQQTFCGSTVADTATFYKASLVSAGGCDNVHEWDFSPVGFPFTSYTLSAFIFVDQMIFADFMGFGQSDTLQRSTTFDDSLDFRIRNGKIELGEHGHPSWSAVYGATSLTESQWHSVAATKDSSGNVKLYLDGVEDASGTIVRSISPNMKMATARRMVENPLSLCFIGQLAHVAVDNVVWTAEQVAAQHVFHVTAS